MSLNAPWLKNYGKVPFELDYPEKTMCEMVFCTAEKYPSTPALSYMGRYISYAALKNKILETAKAFVALGVRKGNMVTICLPNIPQAVYALYALNYIGAIASVIHPLSAVGEIEFYLREVNSDYAITIDQFYPKFAEVEKSYKLKKLIVASAGEELSPIKKIGYTLTSGRKMPKFTENESVISWKNFISGSINVKNDVKENVHFKDTAVILFSGGTTGITKGIQLSNMNFNAAALQVLAMSGEDLEIGFTILAAMPIFHAFGLSVCIHTILVYGGTSILIPRFTAKEYAKLIKKEKPNFIAGVPTLFEAVMRDDTLKNTRLDFFRGIYSGGDTLPVELKKKFDAFLDSHGSPVHIREGYGATETLAACCLTPYHMYREGSIGFPFPDTYFKICKPETTEEIGYDEEGEICISGPSIMVGYYNKPEETANALRTHADGRIWLHTGDLGSMDSDGFIYYKQRIKRMIITSGYNVYPSQLENIIDAHEKVRMSCVIGVKDSYKMQKVKAFVVLKAGFTPSDEIKKELLTYCSKKIAKYAMPYDIEFRDELPKTLVGKIAYTELEKEEARRK